MNDLPFSFVVEVKIFKRLHREGFPLIRDEELGRQLQAGNEAAMEALVHRYHRPIYAYLYRLTGHREVAEDLAQETFIRLLTRIGEYQPDRPFRPWLYTIAHNLYKDYCRAAEQRALPSPEPIPQETPSPIDLTERIAEQAEVAAAVGALGEGEREVLVLRYWGDLKVDQIAAITGIPPGTVKSRLFHAIQKLKRRLLQPAHERRNRA
jgi:RNA polymerase sigma factor (sigma-70 family)